MSVMCVEKQRPIDHIWKDTRGFIQELIGHSHANIVQTDTDTKILRIDTKKDRTLNVDTMLTQQRNGSETRNSVEIIFL